MKYFSAIGLLFFFLLAIDAAAQTDKATTARIVEEKNFIFVATTAIPMSNADLSRVMSRMGGGANSGAINLTGTSYDLRITPDSLVAYLPYYGRAYQAAYNNNEDNGIKFNTKNFTYTSTKRKKGSWDIQLNPKDVRDNIRMNLTVSDSGYATLNVSSTNRQPITFNGYLKAPK